VRVTKKFFSMKNISKVKFKSKKSSNRDQFDICRSQLIVGKSENISFRTEIVEFMILNLVICLVLTENLVRAIYKMKKAFSKSY
jgi:hypothetical protein